MRIVSAAAPLIADAYSREYGIKGPMVIQNVFALSHALRHPKKPKGGVGGSVYWSTVVGMRRAVIGRARTELHLYQCGFAKPDFGGILEGIAADAGATGHLNFLSAADLWELERLASDYDIGPSSEPSSRSNTMALGNKLYSYLLAGIPNAISASKANIAFASEIGAAGKLFPVDDAVALARAIDEWLSDGDALCHARRTAWELGQKRYNWEVEKVKLVAHVDKVVSAASAAPVSVTPPL